MSCEKYEPLNCATDNFGYISITAKYTWYCFNNDHYRFVNGTTILRLDSGSYDVWQSAPYMGEDNEVQLMYEGKFAPLPCNWIQCKGITLNNCDTIKIGNLNHLCLLISKIRDINCYCCN